MEPRKIKGAEIARLGRLRERRPQMWLVPSQSHSGTYAVDMRDGPTCTCPDYEKNSQFCKHIFAVEIFRGQLSISGDAVMDEPMKYTQDWPAYNAAQVNEREHFIRLLHDLCQGIQNSIQTGRGRPSAPLSDIVFAMILKIYVKSSGRRSMGEIKACHEQGLLSTLPSYNTILRYMGDPNLPPLLRMLVQESGSPLAGVEHQFAADSTGFGTTTYDRWYDQKWGRQMKRQKWIKAHVMCGTLTHIASDVIISDSGDAPLLPELIDATTGRFNVEEISADKAYSSKKNLEAIDAAGAVPYIPFKDGTTGKGPELWRRMFHYFQFKLDDFKKHYHRRSNVETVFSMVKGKFDERVRAKTDVAQANEVLGKFLCHNICVLISSIYELEIQPEFWKTEAG